MSVVIDLAWHQINVLLLSMEILIHGFCFYMVDVWSSHTKSFHFMTQQVVSPNCRRLNPDGLYTKMSKERLIITTLQRIHLGGTRPLQSKLWLKKHWRNRLGKSTLLTIIRNITTMLIQRKPHGNVPQSIKFYSIESQQRSSLIWLMQNQKNSYLLGWTSKPRKKLPKHSFKF